MNNLTRDQGIVLIFDGDCSFCTSCVDWLESVLPAMPTTIPFQRADLSGYGLSLDEASQRVWLITPGRQFGGAGAVSALLRHQPDALFRFIGWILQAPPFSWLADAAYAVISRLRHSLPGGTPACHR